MQRKQVLKEKKKTGNLYQGSGEGKIYKFASQVKQSVLKENGKNLLPVRANKFKLFMQVYLVNVVCESIYNLVLSN